MNTDIDFDFAGPIINSSLVIGHLGWLGGVQAVFDTAKSKFTENNWAIGYKGSDFTLHTNCNGGSEVGASLYQRVNSQLEMGVSLSWSAESNATRFALASKYAIDKDASFQAKVNNQSQIGLSYSQELRSGKFKVDIRKCFI
jgi:hypothetical protein